MRFHRLFVLVAVFALPALASAQKKAEEPEPTVLVIDLARGFEQTIRVDAGTYEIQLTNAVPGRKYVMQVGPSQPMEVPAMKMPAAQIAAAPSGPETPRTVCETLAAAVLALATVEQEATVGQRVEELRLALAIVPANECRAQRTNATDTVNASRPTLRPSVAVSADAVRQLTIANALGSTWLVGLNSAGRGVWQTTYGFAFNPNHDEEFFSEATGDKEFTIRRKDRDKDSLTFLPSVFFNWLSSAQAFGDIQHGPTLGIGLTTGGGRLGGLLGYSVRFNQNIGLTAGISIYPHRRLDAKYSENQVLKEALDSDKLNKDSVRGNFFVAFTVRLGASPFGK